jgi:hypothetical protein
VHGRIRRHLSFANVVSVVALFVALGGGAYAAGLVGSNDIARNAIRSKHIKDRQVKSEDVAGASFKDAGLADLPGSCGMANGWFDAPGANVGEYARDVSGFVHLRGDVVRCGSASSTIFQLPEGFRPAHQEQLIAAATGGVPDLVQVLPSGEVLAGGVDEQVLDGLTFRCGPSRQHGCP